jgi:hypothetical protein
MTASSSVAVSVLCVAEDATMSEVLDALALDEEECLLPAPVPVPCVAEGATTGEVFDAFALDEEECLLPARPLLPIRAGRVFPQSVLVHPGKGRVLPLKFAGLVEVGPASSVLIFMLEFGTAWPNPLFFEYLRISIALALCTISFLVPSLRLSDVFGTGEYIEASLCRLSNLGFCMNVTSTIALMSGVVEYWNHGLSNQEDSSSRSSRILRAT